MKDEQKTMWRIAPSDYGEDREVEYATCEEAEAALAAMKEQAAKEDEKRAEWLALHPQPWSEEEKTRAWIAGYDRKSFVEQFEERGWHLKEVPATPDVTRLNTLPSQSPAMMREIEAKMEMFGECRIGWSCTGHTRTEWQTAAAAHEVAAAHPEWKVVDARWHVEIKK